MQKAIEVLAMLAVVLLSGCASIPDKIALTPVARAPKVHVDFRDARTIDDIAGSKIESPTTLSLTFADDQFTQPHVGVLRDRLELELGSMIGKRAVVLRDFQVDLSYGFSMPGGNANVPRPAGVSGGTMVAGGILAVLMIRGIENAKASRQLHSRIRLEIDGEDILVVDAKSVGMNDVGAGLSSLVDNSINRAVEAVREHLAKSATPKTEAAK